MSPSDKFNEAKVSRLSVPLNFTSKQTASPGTSSPLKNIFRFSTLDSSPMNLRETHQPKPFTLQLKPAELEVIIEPAEDLVKDGDESHSSNSAENSPNHPVKPVEPKHSPIVISSIDESSLIYFKPRWDDSSFANSPLRMKNAIKIVEIDEEESD